MFSVFAQHVLFVDGWETVKHRDEGGKRERETTELPTDRLDLFSFNERNVS